MYRVNPLQRNVLITTDEVVFHAPTKHTMDPRMIQQSIIVAEERFIRPALSDELYYAICDTKNKAVTADNKTTIEAEVGGATLAVGDIVNASEYLNADYQALWKQHLWKLTAECVMLIAVPEGFVQFGSEGVVHNAPPAGPMTSGGLVSPELKTVKWSMDKKMMDRIDPLLEAMHTWLCKRKTTYTLYGKPCDCDVNGVAYQRRTDFILGIYDDEDDYRCCE